MPGRRRALGKARDPHSAFVRAGLSWAEASRIVRRTVDLAGSAEMDVPFGEGQMGDMATVTDADIEVARQDWYESDAVPLWAKRLLDARELENA